MTHHKPNRAVEGDPDHGHSRGMPRRPDEDALEQRTARDRAEAGLPAGAPEDPEAQYRAAQDEVDREAGAGEIPTGEAAKKDRDPFPPTRYER
ncbi:hypothetical protein [Streptomyces sp. NPDC049887]|uniref:hypothetical protein n=1 Tax=unclassified Streptomyces TaxID=2593676 RepID=UPI00343B4052